MMYLRLNEKYQIRTDVDNYILEVINVSEKTGKENYRSIGFYGNLSHLVNGLIENEVRTSEFDNINLLIEHIESFKQDVSDMLVEHENNNGSEFVSSK